MYMAGYFINVAGFCIMEYHMKERIDDEEKIQN